MVGQLPYVQEKKGRFYVRLVVPPELRPFVEDGKGEIRRPLGDSLRQVKANHARALASAQDALEAARQAKAHAEGREALKSVRRYAAKTPDQMARDLYRSRLELDELSRSNPAYAIGEINERFVADLRRAAAGAATNADLADLLGRQIERFRQRGNTDVAPSSDEWRRLARVLAVAELEALERVVERDEGDFTGASRVPALLVNDPDPEPPVVVTFNDIIDAEVKRRTAGRGARGVVDRTIEKFRREANAFAKHRKSDNAATVTAAEGTAWIAHMQAETELSNRTIGNALANVRTVIGWGMRFQPDAFPAANPLASVQKPEFAEVPSDERTFTMEEARTILEAAKKETVATYRWVPWLCAYSGSRISEIAQLRPEDFFQVEGAWFYRITTSGGRTTKTKSSIRRVPLHPLLIEQGILSAIEATDEGSRIFNKWSQQRIGQWMREKVGITREHISPNHSWRHLFEDLCTVGGVSDDARAYITGRATGTSRDRYGRSEAALPGLAREMAKIPEILAAV